MFLNCVCSRIKSIFLSIIGLFRRVMCFSRTRSHSNDGDEVLTGVNVQQQNYSPKRQQNHLDRDWSSWDDSPRTVEEHIEKYRETLAQKTAPLQQTGESEPEINFFGDMEPTAIKQAKYYIANAHEEEQQAVSRLQATVEADIPISNELEDWDEDTPKAGWDEINNENTKQLIRENRKELRSQKQKQKGRKSSTTYLQAERLTNDFR